MSQLSEDIELAPSKKEYPNGFATVAAFIAKDRDNTTTIYRRFDRLAARNLLYLQSKVQKLEAVQDELDAEVLRLNEENSAGRPHLGRISKILRRREKMKGGEWKRRKRLKRL